MKPLSRFLSLALALLMIVSVFPLGVQAQTYYINANFDDGTKAPFTTVGTVQASTAKAQSGSYSLFINGANSYAGKNLALPAAYEASISFYPVSASGSNCYLFMMYTGHLTGTASAYAFINSAGAVTVGTTNIGTANFNQWNVLRLEVTSTNHVIPSLNGAASGSITFSGTDKTYVEFGALTSSDNMVCYFDDFIIADDIPATVPTWAASFTSTPGTSGQVGSSYSYTPTTNESATITAPTLPAWATYSGGIVSGTPSAAGTYPFQVHAVSTAGTLGSNQWWNVTVEAAPVIPTWAASFTSTPPETVELGDSYVYSPACNESATFAAEDFPAWAGLVGGEVIGLPNEIGVYPFVLKATSTEGTLDSFQYWNVTVADTTPVPVISGTPPEEATKRVWYQFQPSVDLPNCYWTVTGAGWLTINQYSGKVSGLPTSAGTYNITIAALSTEYGTSAAINYVLTVADVLDPPADTGGDTTDPGGDGGDGIQAIPQTYLIAGIAIFALLVIVLALRRR